MRLSIGLLAMCFILSASPLSADDTPHLRCVTTPTAASLLGRSYLLDTQLFEGGGLMQRVTFGLSDLVDIGVSYGGANIIGSAVPAWQPHCGFHAQVRILEETMTQPALAAGFDTQGDGPYFKGAKLNRFRLKSRGGYIVMSRNYLLLGDLGIHAGANFSLENDDGDEDPSFWAGINKTVGKRIECACEYDFATNDNDNNSITADRGYLNAAVTCTFGSSFTLECSVKNILRNTKMNFSGAQEGKPQPSREIRFWYTGRI